MSNDQPQTPAAPQAPAPQQPTPMKVIDVKKFSIDALTRDTLQNFLNIHQATDFNLKSYLGIIGSTRFGIKEGTPVQFDLQLNDNRIEVRFLAPDTGASAAPVIETAPPVQPAA